MNVLCCEGPCECQLMQQLLDRGLLIFNRNEILDRRPIHFRQPKDIAPLIQTLPIDTEIVFYRIGDTQNDAFDLSCFRLRKDKMSVYKVCTKPEIEILLIINEGLYDEYLKAKSKIAPKQFAKAHIHGYSGFEEYIATHDMTHAMSEYKRLKKHKKDELYLIDLIRQKP